MQIVFSQEVLEILKAVLTAVLIAGAVFACTYYRKRVMKFFNSLFEVLLIIPKIQMTLNDMDDRGNKRACEMRMVFKTLKAILHAIETGEHNGTLSQAQKELDEYLANELS
jgi:hypothetical protein